MRANLATQQPRSAAGRSPGHSQAEQSDLSELIDSGHFAEAAVILRNMRVAAETRQEVILAQVLAVAQQVCLTCQQQMEDVEVRRQSFEDAVARSQELQARLAAIILLANEQLESNRTGKTFSPEQLHQTAAPLQEPAPEATEKGGWWQRIRLFFTGTPPKELAKSDDAEPTEWPGEANILPAPFAGENDETRLSPAGGPSLPAMAAEALESAPPTEGEGDLSVGSVDLEDSATSSQYEPPTSFRSVESAEQNVGSPLAGDLKLLPAGAAVDPSAAPALAVYGLGVFKLYQDEKPITDWPSGKGKSIFKYLITQGRQPVAKEILMSLFWPDAAPDAARNNLNVAIYGLRRALRSTGVDFSHILFQEGCYSLNGELQIWIDFEEFMDRFQSAQQLRQAGEDRLAIQEFQAAEALYLGELFAEDRYDDWLIPLRQKLREMYLILLDQLSSYFYENGEYATCVSFCRKTLLVEACHERTHRRLMRCYCRQNQNYLALRQYHQCSEALENDLNVSPSPATASLYRQIRRHEPV